MVDQDPQDWEANPSGLPLKYHAIAGSFAGVVEHTLVFPIDTIRTSMQAFNDTK